MERWALIICLAGMAQYAVVMWLNAEKAAASTRANELWSQQMEARPFVKHPMPTAVAESTKRRGDFQSWVLAATIVFILSQTASLALNFAGRRGSAKFP